MKLSLFITIDATLHWVLWTWAYCQSTCPSGEQKYIVDPSRMSAALWEYLNVLYFTFYGVTLLTYLLMPVCEMASIPQLPSTSALHRPSSTLPVPSSESIKPGGQYRDDSTFRKKIMQNNRCLYTKLGLFWLCYYWSPQNTPSSC